MFTLFFFVTMSINCLLCYYVFPFTMSSGSINKRKVL